MTERRVTLGRVSGVWGVKGWVRVHSYTQPPENIFRYKPWQLDGARGGEYRLVEGRPQGKGLVALLAQGDAAPAEDRDVALQLVGCDISVPRSALPPVPAGQVYWADLVGCDVFNEQDVRLGKVTAMAGSGAQDVMVVLDDEGDARLERMIPFVRGPIIKDVDVDARRVVADWQPDW